MLVDDDPDDNFIHERLIKKNAAADIVIIKRTAIEALRYLKSKKENSGLLLPDLIFLDINMPGMNGWEFLDEYKELAKEFHSHTLVVMLTTSENPDDMLRAKLLAKVAAFKSKPLTKEMLEEILEKHF